MHRRDWLKWVSASAGLAAIAGGNEQARAQPPMCPTVHMHDTFHTLANARIPANGGIVVLPTFDHEAPARDLRPTYALEQAGRSVPMVVTTLAPGLSRVSAPGSVSGRVTVRGPAGELAVELLREDGPLPTPPHLRAIESSLLESQFAPPGGISVVAKLREPVPEGVVAVIVYKAERPFAKCFAFATPGRSELGIFRTKSHCDGLVPGENPVWVGESLRLAYVDSVGRLSNQSNHVSVR